jgi:hypothetical protein
MSFTKHLRLRVAISPFPSLPPMTATYYSLNELRGLPGLPIAERALRDLAKTWINRPRDSRGGA